jgi:predicted amidohydrolase
VPQSDNPIPPASVRVATVQFQLRAITSLDEFEAQIAYFVGVAADYRADFVVFPELFTLAILSMASEKLAPEAAIDALTAYTPRFRALMTRLAVEQHINIIGGSHPMRLDTGDVRNISFVFLRDGSIHSQDKLHPTPSERTCWGIGGGMKADVIHTDCGPIGVMICYDSEFPELARHLVDQGALLLFVPFCTDDRRGYLRVRYCAQARAVENQCHVILSGVVGNLPNVTNMDVHYGQSAILTPSDFPFARDGIAADTPANSETVAVADLSLTDLVTARESGAVQNLRDRRRDLYGVMWTGD